MICKYCGKEIPELTKFCGYCGMSLQEETAADITGSEEETKTENQEERADEEITEAVSVEEITETIEQTETPEEETIIDAEVKTETAVDEPAVPEKESTVKKIAQSVYCKAKEEFRKNVHKEDFIPILDHLKHPEAETVYTVQASVTVYLFLLISGSIAFHGFGKGLAAELIVMIGALAVQFAEDSRSFHPGKAFRITARVLSIPAVLIFIAALFSFSSNDYIQYTVFTAAAAVKYALGCAETAENSRYGYLHMTIVAAALLCAGFFTGLI